jgi:pantothenate kinase
MIVEKTANQFARELQEKLAHSSTSGAATRFMLGIVGYPGAGKSTTAHLIVNEFNRLADLEQALVVPMDGYHLSNEQLDAQNLREFKGIPETFDAAAFVGLLDMLRQNSGIAYAPLFDRTIEASIPDAIVIRPEHRLLVIEGNYLLLKDPPWNRIRALLNEVWFIDTTIETIFQRLIERHIRGGRNLAGAKEKVTNTDMPNAHLIDGTKIFADRLITLTITGDEIMKGAVPHSNSS